LDARLDAMAARTGRKKAELVNEAVGGFLDYESWVREARTKIDHGYEQAVRGELADGDEVRRRLRKRHDAGLQRSL